MGLSPNIQVKQERTYSAHHRLLDVATRSAERSKIPEQGWRDHVLIAITFSGLALEAFCNVAGDRLVSDWKDFKSSSPIAKLRIICQHLKIPFNRGAQPWQDIFWLVGFRNKIAHAKPEHIKINKIISRQDFETVPGGSPPAILELEMTSEKAEKSVAAVNKVIDKICDMVPVENSLGLRSDGSFDSASSHQ